MTTEDHLASRTGIGGFLDFGTFFLFSVFFGRTVEIEGSTAEKPWASMVWSIFKAS